LGPNTRPPPTAAALLASELLGGICDFAAVFGLGRTLALCGEVVQDVKINSVVIRVLYPEDLFVKDDFLSGFRSVNLVN